MKLYLVESNEIFIIGDIKDIHINIRPDGNDDKYTLFFDTEEYNIDLIQNMNLKKATEIIKKLNSYLDEGCTSFTIKKNDIEKSISVFSID